MSDVIVARPDLSFSTLERYVFSVGWTIITWPPTFVGSWVPSARVRGVTFANMIAECGNARMSRALYVSVAAG